MRSCQLTIAFVLMTSQAFSQAIETDEGILSDMNHMHDAGFVSTDMSWYRKDPVERDLIEKTIAAPIASTLNQGVPFGFDYLLTDLDGDGLNDLVVRMKIFLEERGEGNPTYVYLFDDGNWRLALESGSMGVGLRRSSNGRYEIALNDGYPKGFRRYRLADGSYQLAATVPSVRSD